MAIQQEPEKIISFPSPLHPAYETMSEVVGLIDQARRQGSMNLSPYDIDL
jgi:hypothetical protein